MVMKEHSRDVCVRYMHLQIKRFKHNVRMWKFEEIQVCAVLFQFIFDVQLRSQICQLAVSTAPRRKPHS